MPRYELGDISQLLALDYGYILHRVIIEADTDPDQDPRPMAYFSELVSCASRILDAERLRVLSDHRHCWNHNHYVFLYLQCDTFKEFHAFMTNPYI